MKHAASIFLAVACIGLSIALICSRARSPDGAPIYVSNADPFPLNSDEDLTLLDRRIEQLQLKHVPLDDAIQTLSQKSGVNIAVNWDHLSKEGIDRRRPVDLFLVNAPLSAALTVLLRSFTPDDPKTFDFYLSDGVVTIADADETARHPVTAYFDIRPLLEETFAAYKRDRIPPAEQPARDELIEQVAKLITDLVEADTWRDSGGTEGSLRELGGVLIIQQSPGNIRKVRDVLWRLHRTTQTGGLPLTEPPTSDPAFAASAGANPSAPSTTQPATPATTAYFNIRSILIELSAGKPSPTPMGFERGLSTADAFEEVESSLMQTVDPNSWRDNGGTTGSFHTVGMVLVITQTPANIQAVRLALQNLQAAIPRNDFVPATRPTTQESKPGVHAR